MVAYKRRVKEYLILATATFKTKTKTTLSECSFTNSFLPLALWDPLSICNVSSHLIEMTSFGLY